MNTQQHVIAGCFLDPDKFDDLSLSVDDFTGQYKDIWSAMIDLRNQDIPIDPISVGKSVGIDPMDMMHWYDLIPSTANLGYYAKNVKEEADRRKLINITQDALTSLKENGKPSDVRGELEKSLYDMEETKTGTAVWAKDFVKKVVGQIEEAFKRGGQLTGLRTGFETLNNATCGFQNGDLIIIGARPSVGKTAIGMNIAETISVDNQRTGLVISREMNKEALIHRMVCSRAGVDTMKAKRGTFRDTEFPSIAKASHDIIHSQLIIDDRELNIQQIRAEARRQKRKNDIKYVLVDYVQLIKAPGYTNRTDEVEFVCGQLKAMAKELNIPVIALAQINRESDKEKGLPRLDQLKGSGALEQDADVVLLLHREKKAVSEEAKLIIAKQRNGPLWIIDLWFDGSLTRFTERNGDL